MTVLLKRTDGNGRIGNDFGDLLTLRDGLTSGFGSRIYPFGSARTIGDTSRHLTDTRRHLFNRRSNIVDLVSLSTHLPIHVADNAPRSGDSSLRSRAHRARHRARQQVCTMTRRTNRNLAQKSKKFSDSSMVAERQLRKPCRQLSYSDPARRPVNACLRPPNRGIARPRDPTPVNSGHALRSGADNLAKNGCRNL